MLSALPTRFAALLLFICMVPKACADDESLSREGHIKLCDGRCLAYREYGDPHGQLVFYFHGTPGSRLEVALVSDEAFAAGIHLIAVDRPGLGRSTYDPCRRIIDWPGDVAQLANSLDYTDRQFGVIGFSGGAPYASACVLKIPDRIKHAAIVSGHTPPGSQGVCSGTQDKMIQLITKRPRLGKFGVKLINRRLDRKPDKIVNMIAKNWTAADRQLVLCNPHYYRHLVENLNEAGRCGAAGMVKDIRLLGSCWGFQLCQLQGVPVSIWQGRCDRIATPSMGRYFHRSIAGSELTEDPRAGHVTMLKWHINDIYSRFVQ